MKAAKPAGVDPSTLAKWTQGEGEPIGVFPGWVKRFLMDEELRPAGARRVG
jgi:hypothetical protein